MRRNIFKIIGMALIFSILYGVFLYYIIKEDKECDEHVILNDNQEYDCRSVSSYENGMSRIKLCDGKEIEVPTQRIKVITQLTVGD
jgi:hypothetical protein